MHSESALGPKAGTARSRGAQAVVGAHLPTRRVFGFDFISSPTVDAVAELVLGPQPDDGRLPLVLTPNVDYLVRLDQPANAVLRERLRRSRYVLPDGQPIVWTSRFSGGEPLAARLPGSSLFPPLWKRIAAERRPTVVVASNEETAERLRLEHPEIGVVVPPFFSEHDADALAAVVRACRDQIDKVEAEFVFVGISFPKQQLISLALIDELERDGRPVPIFLTLGASFEMHLGLHRRAPRIFQQLGMEWLFRFLLEPRRLFRRYFVTDARFALLFLKQLRSGRTHPAPDPV